MSAENPHNFEERRETSLSPLLPELRMHESLPQFETPEEQVAYLAAHSLGHTVGQMLMTKLVAEINDAERQELTQEAIIDETTGLLNKRGFAKAYRNIEKTPDAKPAMIAFGDLDRFKELNTDHGHVKVDGLLREIAAEMTDSVREQDIVASYGGDEFAIILQSVSPEVAAKIIQRMQERVSGIKGTHDMTLGDARLSMSVGLAQYDPDLPMEEVLHNAGLQLKLAKDAEGGKGQIFFDGQPISYAPPQPELVA